MKVRCLEMYKRRIIGIIGIVVGLVAWFAFYQKTSSGIYEYPSYVNFLIFIMCMWIVISLSSKIAMIFEKRLWLLPFFSIVLFFVFTCMYGASVHAIVPSERIFFYEALVRLCLLIWFLVDLQDLGFFYSEKLRLKAVQKECNSIIEKGNEELKENYAKINRIKSAYENKKRSK
jgi:Ca2+/Na+ antiporter